MLGSRARPRSNIVAFTFGGRAWHPALPRRRVRSGRARVYRNYAAFIQLTLDSTHTLAETVPAALQGLAAVTLAPVNAQGHTPHSLGHRKHLPVASRPRNALALAYVTFIVVYLGTIALMTCNRSFAFWPGHSRYLAPVYVPVVLARVLALDRIRPWGRRNRGGALPRLLKSLRAAWAVAGILARVRADLAASPATRYMQAHLTPGHLQPSAATRLYPGGCPDGARLFARRRPGRFGALDGAAVPNPWQGVRHLFP